MVEPATTQMAAPSEVHRAVHVQRLPQHEALAVEEGDGGEVQAVGGVAPLGPGDGADQHVDLARLQRRQPRLGGERHPADLGGVAEHGGGDRAAEVGVDAAIHAAAVGQAEAGGAGGGAAGQDVARLHRGQGRARRLGLRAGLAAGAEGEQGEESRGGGEGNGVHGRLRGVDADAAAGGRGHASPAQLAEARAGLPASARAGLCAWLNRDGTDGPA